MAAHLTGRVPQVGCNLTSMSELPSHASVLVVGGGTAGCVVAGRLAEQGHHAVILEAGPDHGPRASGTWPADLLDARSLPTSHDWGYADERLRFDRARVIGGCSA